MGDMVNGVRGQHVIHRVATVFKNENGCATIHLHQNMAKIAPTLVHHLKHDNVT